MADKPAKESNLEKRIRRRREKFDAEVEKKINPKKKSTQRTSSSKR